MFRDVMRHDLPQEHSDWGGTFLRNVCNHQLHLTGCFHSSLRGAHWVHRSKGHFKMLQDIHKQ
jgi:hypothetical protein